MIHCKIVIINRIVNLLPNIQHVRFATEPLVQTEPTRLTWWIKENESSLMGVDDLPVIAHLQNSFWYKNVLLL